VQISNVFPKGNVKGKEPGGPVTEEGKREVPVTAGGKGQGPRHRQNRRKVRPTIP